MANISQFFRNHWKGDKFVWIVNIELAYLNFLKILKRNLKIIQIFFLKNLINQHCPQTFFKQRQLKLLPKNKL